MTVVSATSRQLNLPLLKVRWLHAHTSSEGAGPELHHQQKSRCIGDIYLLCVSPSLSHSHSLPLSQSHSPPLVLQLDCVSVCSDSPAASEVKLSSVFRRASALQPCILLLRNLQLLIRPRGGTERDGRVPAALRRLLSGVPGRSSRTDGVTQPDDSGVGSRSVTPHISVFQCGGGGDGLQTPGPVCWCRSGVCPPGGGRESR